MIYLLAIFAIQFSDAQATECSIYNNCNLTATKFISIGNKSYSECCKLCADFATTHCASWVWEPTTVGEFGKGVCQLKSDYTSRQTVAAALNYKCGVRNDLTTTTTIPVKETTVKYVAPVADPIATPTASSICSFYQNKIINGDQKFFDAVDQSKEDCCSLCELVDGCVAFTWTPNSNSPSKWPKGACYFKTNFQSMTTKSGLVSGSKTQCTKHQDKSMSSILGANGSKFYDAVDQTADDCCTLCNSIVGCVAYDWMPDSGDTSRWAKGKCLFRTEITTLVASGGRISGALIQ